MPPFQMQVSEDGLPSMLALLGSYVDLADCRKLGEGTFGEAFRVGQVRSKSPLILLLRQHKKQRKAVEARCVPLLSKRGLGTWPCDLQTPALRQQRRTLTTALMPMKKLL